MFPYLVSKRLRSGQRQDFGCQIDDSDTHIELNETPNHYNSGKEKRATVNVLDQKTGPKVLPHKQEYYSVGCYTTNIRNTVQGA